MFRQFTRCQLFRAFREQSSQSTSALDSILNENDLYVVYGFIFIGLIAAIAMLMFYRKKLKSQHWPQNVKNYKKNAGKHSVSYIMHEIKAA